MWVSSRLLPLRHFILSTFCHPLNSSPFFPLSSPSLRLACKDFEQQRKMEEKKMKGLEGNKKVQSERLGMGMGMRRYDDDDDDEDTSGPVVDIALLVHGVVVALSQRDCLVSLLRQWSVSLRDVGHAHHPAGESDGKQEHQSPALHRRRRGRRLLQRQVG